MGRDDSSTLAALKAHRRELIDPKIAEHSGRIVKTTGDGLLLEFPSVVDAVRCAVDVQRGMAQRNAGVPADQRLDFRVGINLGDIIIDGDGDIYGDGVNVAARLEALAEPGEICVSKVVRDQVLDKLSFAFDELGAQKVKNIARPVDVYRIDLACPASRRPRRIFWQRLLRVSRARVLAAGLGVAFLAIGAWWSHRMIDPAPTSLPRGFSLAIMPFSAPTKERADGHLAEALSMDLVSSLTRSMPWASVVSSGVAGSYAGKAIDARAIGRELNVRYLMEGAVRTSGERLDVKAWLTEASTGTEVWSNNLELENATEIADRQGLINRLTNQVRAALIDSEWRRVRALPVSALNAEELSDRADATWQREPEPSLKLLDEAGALYDKALQLNPTLASAMMGQANVLAEMLDRDPPGDRDRLLRKYDQMSLRLIASADRQARAWNIRADALQRQWRWEAALEANASAQRLDPTRFGTMLQRAGILTDMGRPEEALVIVDRAFSLQPPAGFSGEFALNECRAKLALGRYADAINACEKAASTADLFYRRLSVHMFLAAAYALQGNDGRAQAEKLKFLAQWPGASIAQLRASHISDVPAYLQQTEAHLHAGLRKAGIREQ